MDSADPYYTVQDDVIKNIESAEKLYADWIASTSRGPEITHQTANSLRQIIRGIEWDLEDIQETVNIVENNPPRFQLSAADVDARHQFLRDVRDIVKSVKSELAKGPNQSPNKRPIRFKLTAAKRGVNGNLPNGNMEVGGGKDATNLVGLPHSLPLKLHQGVTNQSFHRDPSDDPLTIQKQMLRHQDERLDQLGTSINTLKNISNQIGSEIEEQIVLLDDFNSEMVQTDSKLDSVTKRTARLLHLSTDRRQWCAIFSLSLTLFIILILLAVL